MWFSEYRRSPEEVDRMSINEIYMILYARVVRSINDRFKELSKPAGMNTGAGASMNAKYGEVVHLNDGAQ